MRLPINHNGHIATCVANAHAHGLKHTHTHAYSHTRSLALPENCCIPCGVMALAAPFSLSLSPSFAASHPTLSLRALSLLRFVSHYYRCLLMIQLAAFFNFRNFCARREKSFASKKGWEKFRSASSKSLRKNPKKIQIASISAAWAMGATGVFLWQI